MIIDLVDSLEYTTTNCFAHQLHKALHQTGNVITVPLSDIGQHPKPEKILCRLKQRTFHRVIDQLQVWCSDAPITIFDQDPWHAYMDGSPYKGVYERAVGRLNVDSFAVTTSWWADFIAQKGLPSRFVRMWVLPEYCSDDPAFVDRPVPVGFVGALHPYRRQLFDRLEEMGTNVIVQGGGLGYADYLKALSGLQVFVHNEDAPITIDGQPANLNVGLWIKDVEAAARGCFTIRNRGVGENTYLAEIRTAFVYDDPAEVPDLIADIQRMDPKGRQTLIDATVENIRKADGWLETAITLAF